MEVGCRHQFRSDVHRFLQPLGDRKLELNLPNTALCEMAEGGKEDLLWLTTDASGHVVHVDRPITWKRKFVADVSIANDDDARTNDDTVVAVRKVPFSKPHVPVQNQTVAVAERDLDRILNGDPKRLSYGVQKYVQCRGAHAALYRVQWTRGSTNNTAVDIVNKLVSQLFRGIGAAPVETDPFEMALRDAAILARFTCVSSAPTSLHADDNVIHTWPPDLHAAKLRGRPIAPAVDAIQRIVAHAQTHIPAVQFNDMEADFVKDAAGTWWCLQVKSFRYEMRVPGVVALLRESKLVDSLVHVPKLLRRRPTRCNFHDDDSTNTSTTDIAAMRQDSSDLHPPSSACFLCHNSFDLTDADALGLVLDDDDQHVSMGAAATRRGYAMTFHMVSDTLTSLRHRGVHLSSWEASLHRATSIPAASECRVCLVCYQIYKHQAAVCDTAAAIHSFFVPPPIMPTLLVDSAGRRTKHDSILQRIDAFRQERDPQDFTMPEEEEESAADHLRIVRGPDVDPNCQQFCFFLLFHELQDVLGRDDPTNYHLEYQLGQTFSTLSFDGPKVHTAHRWQLCEARAHYAVATPDALRTMCRDHKIQIKMKTTHTHAFEGHAVLSLKPLLGQASAAAASIDNGGDHDDDDDNDRLQGPSHCGVLVHVKTHSLGLLKLKVTLGVFGTHQHDFAALQGAIAGVDFVQEHQVFWPDVSYYQPSIAVPIEWMPLFAPPDLFGLNAEGVAAIAGPLRLEAIALLAELLFVLLDTHCIPSMLPLSDSLEPLVSPYWLQQSPTKVLAWLTPQDAPSSCPSQHRILWNRAVRRCHLAGFTAHPDAAFLATHEWPSSVHMNAADVVAHKRRLRTRLRLLLLMHLFERIEAYDSGYMDMGEFRCLPQQLQQQADATNAADAKATIGGATGSHLIAWDSALRRQWTTAVTETTRDLVASAHFQDAFAGFDQFGSGGIGFRVMSDASFVSPSLGVSHRPDDEFEGRAGSFEDEDKLYPSSRQYSYFQSMEASSMTKDFQDKVQTRIRQRYRSVERVPDDLNPHTLAAILTRLEAAERDAKSTYPCVHASMPRLPTNHDHPPPHTTDDNDDAQREDHHKAAALRVLRRRERLRPLAHHAPKKTVHPTQQQVAIDRLHAVPKSRRKRESYSALLQKELHLQLRPPDDLLDRIGRHQRKKKAVQFSCRLKCGL
ncbi:hypothetical protein DYB28_000113 [Aphanomyces astaci]|uniref:Uncharacterized protein n=1 Tax=Aphanomyces astaci TaxID=112090 RepID=A0A9X8DWE9_APHAT|nr:hypothetical protein DYB28_000113 [Aphanomyces astaci]